MNGLTSGLMIHILLFLASILYALLLEYLNHKWPELFDYATALTVVVGVGYTLGILSLDPAGLSVSRLWTAFAVSGTPIVIRSLHNYLRDYRRLLDQLTREGSDGHRTKESA